MGKGISAVEEESKASANDADAVVGHVDDLAGVDRNSVSVNSSPRSPVPSVPEVDGLHYQRLSGASESGTPRDSRVRRTPTDLLSSHAQHHSESLLKALYRRFNLNRNVVNTALFVAITMETIAAALPNKETPAEYKHRHNFIIPLFALPLIIAGGFLPKKIKYDGREIPVESLQEVLCAVAHLPAISGGVAMGLVGYYSPNSRPTNNWFLLGFLIAALGYPSWLIKESLNVNWKRRLGTAFLHGLGVAGVAGMARRIQKGVIDYRGGFDSQALEDTFDLNTIIIEGIALGATTIPEFAFLTWILLRRISNHGQVHKLIKFLAFLESIVLETNLSILFPIGSIIGILATNQDFADLGIEPLNLIWPMLYNAVFLALSLYTAAKDIYLEATHPAHGEHNEAHDHESHLPAPVHQQALLAEDRGRSGNVYGSFLVSGGAFVPVSVSRDQHQSPQRRSPLITEIRAGETEEQADDHLEAMAANAAADLEEGVFAQATLAEAVAAVPTAAVVAGLYANALVAQAGRRNSREQLLIPRPQPVQGAASAPAAP